MNNQANRFIMNWILLILYWNTEFLDDVQPYVFIQCKLSLSLIY